MRDALEDINTAWGIAPRVTSYAGVYALVAARRSTVLRLGQRLQRFIVLGRFDLMEDGRCMRLPRRHFDDEFRRKAPLVMTVAQFLAHRKRFAGPDSPYHGEGSPRMRPPLVRCDGCGGKWSFVRCDAFRVELDDAEHPYTMREHAGFSLAEAQGRMNAGRTDCSIELLPCLLPFRVTLPTSTRLSAHHVVPANVVRYFHEHCGETAVHGIAGGSAVTITGGEPEHASPSQRRRKP